MQNQFLPETAPVASPVQQEAIVTPPENDTETVSTEEMALKELLAQTKQRLRKRQKRVATLITLSLPAYCTLLMLPLKLMPPTTGQAPINAILTMGLLTALYVAFLILGIGSFAFDPEELAHLGGVRAIDPLLDALATGVTPKQRKAIYAALNPLLRELKASDAHLLTPAHRKFLYTTLRSDPYETPMNPAFQLAILKALEQVGDREALPIVQRLANLKGRSEHWRQLRDAAKECLPHLKTVMNDNTANQTLLRASSAATATPETLLRPATAGSETSSEQLLRPSDGR